MATPTLNHRLAQRRIALLKKSGQQRNALQLQALQARQSLSVVDAGLRIAGHVKRHPLIIAGVVAAAVIVKPKKLFSWLNKGMVVWRVWQGIRPRTTSGDVQKNDQFTD